MALNDLKTTQVVTEIKSERPRLFFRGRNARPVETRVLSNPQAGFIGGYDFIGEVKLIRVLNASQNHPGTPNRNGRARTACSSSSPAAKTRNCFAEA
ncbi:hypothetical protein BT96DRAFT_928867 [Gymnopus androsaceus JB14]|uniref:Uncharacterized protein n=1 Tax=Gymnopus androsaceus JB14 TaxID=1447944 RepID=A0A6A4GJ18_9AGAR|nr:hypothetical protein BT96DRAFT_928867 [Gymnopus androsaceus JB14]